MTHSYVIVGLVILLLIVAVGIVTVMSLPRAGRQTRSQSSDSDEHQVKYPEGRWLGVGIGMSIELCVGLGVPIGIALDNLALGLALGPSMGVAMGVAIGSALEQRHKDEIRPLTEDERRTRRIAMIAGVAVLAIGVLALAAILLARAQG
jgi:ABC-type Fe3+ transport system permease subunit